MLRNKKIEKNSSLVDDDNGLCKTDKTVKIVDIQRLIKLRSGQVYIDIRHQYI